MSITKELREYNRKPVLAQDPEQVERIADRIDDAHRAECEMQYRAGFAVSTAPINMEDEDLAELGLIRLPVDADGEPWHVGDAVSSPTGPHQASVEKMILTKSGWQLGTEGFDMYPPEKFRHHKPTPAERIREWVARQSEYQDTEDMPMDELLAIADELEGREQ